MSYLVTNKIVTPTKQTRGFVTDFHAPIWELCLSVMDNMSFEVKKCWKCIFPGSHPRCLLWEHLTRYWYLTDTDTPDILANSKETQSLSKSGCRQKCLDKSLNRFMFRHLMHKKSLRFITEYMPDVRTIIS